MKSVEKLHGIFSKHFFVKPSPHGQGSSPFLKRKALTHFEEWKNALAGGSKPTGGPNAASVLPVVYP
jgi:hypothetical protein